MALELEFCYGLEIDKNRKFLNGLTVPYDKDYNRHPIADAKQTKQNKKTTITPQILLFNYHRHHEIILVKP